jgi:DNA-binding XRE family transcriptional regulator
MAKDGPGTSSKPSRTRPDRKVRSPPIFVPPALVDKHVHEKQRPAAHPELCAEGERSQLELQRIFGVNLKEARLKSALKQSDVATMTGLTQQYLSLIEAGQQNVTIKTMALLAKVVDHSLIHLLQEALGAAPKKE